MASSVSIPTIIHVEDDPLWADFVSRTIKSFREFRLLGTASTGTEGILRSRAMAPRIVVLDLRLPDMDGLAAIEQLGALRAPPRILLFTARADDAVIARLFRDPIAGMLWKLSTAGPELRLALATIARGGTHYATEAQLAWQRLNAAPDSYVNLLTGTELRLLPALGQGCSDAEIAAAQGGRPSTVHTHRKNIMSKLGLHSLAELQKWALERGIYDPPRPAPPGGIPWTETKVR